MLRYRRSSAYEVVQLYYKRYPERLPPYETKTEENESMQRDANFAGDVTNYTKQALVKVCAIIIEYIHDHQRYDANEPFLLF